MVYAFLMGVLTGGLLFALAGRLRPSHLVAAHRYVCRRLWAWKSRRRGGRPRIGQQLIGLIRRMSLENPRWGSQRLRQELLRLGFKVAKSTIDRYRLRRPGPPEPGWKTFLLAHADAIAAIDLLTIQTLVGQRLYAFVVLGLRRRKILHIEVTDHPTALWLAQQITEAFPWDEAPACIIRDNDGAYGTVFRRRLKAMGILDKPITPHCPWQNGYAERLIGSIRRECLEHLVILNRAHLRRTLRAYADYYNQDRPHQSLDGDAPDFRPVEPHGRIVSRRILGGLHHRYARIRGE